MKIEDCEAGMKVKSKYELSKNIKEGSILEISIVCDDFIEFKNYKGYWLPKHFEPANKFEVDEKVIYKSFDSQTIKKREEAVIFGIAPEKDKLKREYAISYIFEGPYGKKEEVNKIVAEHKLLPFKKKDELEVGDKFIDTIGREQEVLGISYCKLTKIKKYFTKRKSDGFVSIFNKHSISEIIYD